MPYGVFAHLTARKPHHLRNSLSHGGDISGLDEPTRLGHNEFGDTATGESDDRRTATHRLGDHQAIRFIPHRGNQSRLRPTDQPCQIILVEVTGVSNLVIEMRSHLGGKVMLVGDRSGEDERPAGQPGRGYCQVRRLFGRDPAEPDQGTSALTQRPAPYVNPVGHHGDISDGLAPRRGRVFGDGSEPGA